MNERTCLSVILAAGEGTRMKSALPKTLHPVAGLPMVAHVVRAAVAAGAGDVALVVGNGADAVGAAASRWRFLSGAGVAQLGEAFGIGAIERARIRQFVHPVAVFTLTPAGRISHVLPGLQLTPSDLRLALVDASDGTIGNVIDHIVLWCAGYDTSTGKYTAPMVALLRAGAIGTVVLGLAGIVFLEIRKRRWTA